MQKLSLGQAKQIDLVDYLAYLGYQPKKITGQDYLYRSPLPGRNDTSPSFTVDRIRNVWYDHGVGRGGSIIDFGMQYYGCSIPELLEILQTSFSFHRVYSPAPQQSTTKIQASGPINTPSSSSERKKIRVVSTGPITSPALIHYLGQRKIPVELAQAYCQEVWYELASKQYNAIGFANNGGGYELRNPYFKGGSSPKGITFFDNGVREVAVFEGFFDFLSLLVLYQNRDLSSTNLLVLNSLSYFEKNRQLMEKHDAINLYLDRDTAGMKCTAQALKYSSRYKDISVFYQGQKDLNQWLIQNFHQVQQEMQSLNRAKGLALIMKNVEVSRGKGRRI